MDIPRPPALRRAHPGMAEGAAQEECSRAVRDSKPRRYHRVGDRAGHHRKLSATHPPAERSCGGAAGPRHLYARSEAHTSELQSLMRISSAVFCLKKKNKNKQITTT